jgi:hypothetical protein
MTVKPQFRNGDDSRVSRLDYSLFLDLHSKELPPELSEEGQKP